jgi:ankyrin repeat protein/truncated hemoglobin YjbI
VSNLYETIGGTAKCLELSTALYARIGNDPLLRPLFPGKNHRCAIEAFAAFLVQFLGGPSEDTQRRWWLSLDESHRRFKIGQTERDAWMSHMIQALDDARFEEPFRGALRGLFERGSAYLVNHGHGRSEPPGEVAHQEIARRWQTQLGLDEAVAAVRGGDADRAIAFAGSLELEPAVLAALFKLMIGSGSRAMHDYVLESVRRDPNLARETHSGRTLLHDAAAAGSSIAVELLLHLGADPNAGVHPPLYCVGNECNAPGGGNIVRALVRSGADVDAREGPKRCSALHMAARRGHVEVAAALLDCGASIEARDSLGDTPLRRAVNCGKTEVAALLLARGADLQSIGSKGITPLLAARTDAMKLLLKRESNPDARPRSLS